MNNFNPPGRLTSGRKRKYLIIISLVVGLVVLSLASSGYVDKRVADIFQQTAAEKQKSADDLLYTPDKQLKIEGKNNVWNVFGAARPKITIVEFSDFTCPFSHENFPVIRAMMVKHQADVKFIWRDRPPSERSVVLALTARCAGAQGKFWPMHDKLFQNQSDTLGNQAADLLNLGESLNLDMAAFKLCLTNRTYLEALRQDTLDSVNLGVNGTPTFFINGKKYEGEMSEQDFETIIKELQ